MDFTYGTFSLFSRIEARGQTLQAAFGGYLLDINFGFAPNNPPAGAMVIENLQAVVSLGEPKRQLGIAYPIPTSGSPGTITFRSMPDGRQFEIIIGFRLHLSKAILEEVEAVRNGRDAMFQLTVHGNMVGYATDGEEPSLKRPGDPWSAHILLNAGPHRVYRHHPGIHNLVLNVPQSDWIKQLEAAGYERSMLIEVSLSDGTPVSEGERHLRYAQDAFSQGRYADTASRCRDALDSVIQLRQIGQRALFKAAIDEDTRRQMTAEDAFGLAWASIRQITNASHHRNGMHVEFTRSMAQFVLGATALALNLAGKERDIFTRLRETAETKSE